MINRPVNNQKQSSQGKIALSSLNLPMLLNSPLSVAACLTFIGCLTQQPLMGLGAGAAMAMMQKRQENLVSQVQHNYQQNLDIQRLEYQQNLNNHLQQYQQTIFTHIDNQIQQQQQTIFNYIDNQAQENQQIIFTYIDNQVQQQQENQAQLQTALTRIEKKTHRLENTFNDCQKQVSKLQHKQNSYDNVINELISKVDRLTHQIKEQNKPTPQLTEQTMQVQRYLASQATPKPDPVIPQAEPQKLTRVIIDGNNYQLACQQLLGKVDVKNLITYIINNIAPEGTEVSLTCVIGNSKHNQRLIQDLKKNGVQVIPCEVKKEQDGKNKTQGDDIKIADLMKESRPGEHVILLSGDGDFVDRVKEIQATGVTVTLLTHLNLLSGDLFHAADKFIDLQYIWPEIAQYELFEESPLNPRRR